MISDKNRVNESAVKRIVPSASSGANGGTATGANSPLNKHSATGNLTKSKDLFNFVLKRIKWLLFSQ
jgi:hypothetical protein